MATGTDATSVDATAHRAIGGALLAVAVPTPQSADVATIGVAAHRGAAAHRDATAPRTTDLADQYVNIALSQYDGPRRLHRSKLSAASPPTFSAGPVHALPQSSFSHLDIEFCAVQVRQPF